MIIDNNVSQVVNSLVGAFEVIKDHRNNSGRTGVIEINANEERMFVKTFNRLSRWSPEVYAYKNWTNMFGEYAPKLLHHFTLGDTHGIITTPIRGKTINENQITDEDVLDRVYYKAGELLRHLHNNVSGTYFGIPAIDGKPLENKVIMDPVVHMSSGLEGILKWGCDMQLFNIRDKELVEWCIKQCDVFTNSKPVPTNWDFSQNNWMVDDTCTFTGFIDFENMLWGIDVDSFGVTIERYTHDRPKLLKSFYAGYELEKNIERELQIKIISVKMAIADISYGTSIKNDRLITLGRKLLNHLED